MLSCIKVDCMSEILEIIMMLCFGISWPINIYKSYKIRSTKGKSAVFLCFILIGYIAGITSKLTNEFYIASFNQKHTKEEMDLILLNIYFFFFVINRINKIFKRNNFWWKLCRNN